MRIYRGPSTVPFWDDRHDLVFTIKPEVLEASISNDSYIKFNITKEGYERQAVCTAKFDHDDIIPMLNGLIERLKKEQEAVIEIQSVIFDQEMKDEEKVCKIKDIVRKIYR